MTSLDLRAELQVPTRGRATNQTWRVTTAVRSFGLAIVVGQLLDDHAVGAATEALVGLCLVATAACVAELHVSRPGLPWVSVSEGLTVGLLVGLAGADFEPLALVIAIPPVASGVSGGRFGTVYTWLATALAYATAATAGGGPSALRLDAAVAALWLSIGLGAGMLAAHQARSLRRAEAAKAPYVAAHRLVAQLHSLIKERPELLDVSSQATTLRESLHAATAADRSAVVLQTHDGLEPVSTSGLMTPLDEEVSRLCSTSGLSIHRGDCHALPLRVGSHVIGALVLTRPSPIPKARLESLQTQVDEHAVRLETAILVDDVRKAATEEERKRLAREIHDGVAQRVVGLGYLADEVAATSQETMTRDAAEQLRQQITRLISELRFSVFDLRHDVERAGGLSAALSEYAQELSTHSQLRVHLTLDVQEAQLPRRTETELLRIAQEALGNAHRHARAINVWVTLQVAGSRIRLVVEDDGVGGATPRDGHFGMRGMRERAERIDADLEIVPRPDGGTAVTVRSRTDQHTTGEGQHDQRLARR